MDLWRMWPVDRDKAWALRVHESFSPMAAACEGDTCSVAMSDEMLERLLGARDHFLTLSEAVGASVKQA